MSYYDSHTFVFRSQIEKVNPLTQSSLKESESYFGNKSKFEEFLSVFYDNEQETTISIDNIFQLYELMGMDDQHKKNC
jgi:hypothetical protein